MDTRNNKNIPKSKEKFVGLRVSPARTDMSTSQEDGSLLEKLERSLSLTSYPLAKHPDRQAIFLKEVQQALEEGQELSRLSDIIDAALAQTKPSRFTTWWSKPSAFHEALIRYQKQIQLSFPAESPKKSQFVHRTYGTSKYSPSVEINILDADNESPIFDEKTPLLSQPSRQFKKTGKEKIEEKESVDTLLPSIAEENYTAYQRLIIGYRSRTTGILDLEKASQHLITGALQGQMDAIRLLNIVPSDPLTVFNSATHQEAWFSTQLKSITPHEPLYSQAQWRLFLLVYSRRYQQGVYADYETRFSELQQAVSYLHAYITSTKKPDAILATAAKAFLVLDGDERESIRKSAWNILQKEIQGQDPLVDWYKSVLRPVLEKEPATSLEEAYPFRILPSEAVTIFCEANSDLVPIEHKGMAKEIQRISEQPSFQLQYVEADEKSEYILTLTKSPSPFGKPQTTVFLDREKKTEVARVICDGKRFLFYAYGDTVQLVLPTSDSCHYYKIHNPIGTLILQANLSEKTQYLEVQVKRCVIAEGSKCWAEKLKIEAEETDQHGHLKAGTLQLHTAHDLSNHETGQIEATSQLRLTGGSVWNAGKIVTTGKGVISLNGIFFHGISSLELLKQATQQMKWPGTAVLEGGDFTIVAGVYVNLLSRVWLRNGSLMTLVEINLGMGVTVNMTKSRLLAMDSGVDLPHFPQMVSDASSFVESWATKGFIGALNQLDKFRLVANGLSVVRWFIRSFVPAAGKVTDMAWTAGMFAMSVPGLSQQCQELYQKKQQGKPLEWRDMYGLIALTGSMANQLFFLGSQIEDIVTAKETPSPKTTESDVTTPQSTESSSYWQSPNQPVPMLALNVLALFAPTQTDDAFLKIKSGVHVTGSLLDRSILPIGIGHSAIALNISNLFFCSIQSRTVQVANNISETGHALTKSDSIVIANNHFTDLTSQHTSDRMYVKRLFWQTHEYKDESIISAQEITITSQRQGVHEGILEARVAVVRGEELIFTPKSQVHADSIQIESKHLHHHGQTRGKQVMFTGEATIEDSGHIVAEAMQYQTQEKLTRLPTAFLEAKQVIMDGGEGQVVEQGRIYP